MAGLLPFLYADQTRRPLPIALAQDAAGATDRAGPSPTGAFCLALGQMPPTEIAQVLRRREVRSKVVVPASLLNLTPQQARELREEGALGRTVLPLSWFLPGAEWEPIIAKMALEATDTHR